MEALQTLLVGLGSGTSRGERARSYEKKAVNEILVIRESLNDSAQFEVPNDYLGIFASTGNKSIALAHVYLRNEIKVPVKAGLQRKSVSVPDLQDAAKTRKRFD